MALYNRKKRSEDSLVARATCYMSEADYDMFNRFCRAFNLSQAKVLRKFMLEGFDRYKEDLEQQEEKNKIKRMKEALQL